MSTNKFLIFTNLIQANLTTKVFGNEIEYLTFTDSTNEDVWESLENDIDEGFLCITDNQKKGRGRRGNNWLSEPGASLSFSFLIKPQIPLDKVGLISLLAGVSVVEGISNFTNLDCKLKWPNDIIINKKKVGGILAESKQCNGDIFVVMGIGLNVNEQVLPFEIVEYATSLRLEKKSPIQREPLLASILNAFESLYNVDYKKWVELWNYHCLHLNSDVKFHHGNEIIQGTFLEINNMGQAIFNINGNNQKFSTGIIELP